MECSNDSLGDLHNDQSNGILDAGVETSTVTGGDRGGDEGGISGDTLTVTSQLGSALSYAETVTMKEIQSSVFARGGFGEIRLGTSISGQLLALKSLYVRSKSQPDFRGTKRFRREFMIWSGLRHPNVLPFLGTTQTSDLQTCFVSPYMRNGNSKEFLHQHPDTPVLPIIQGISRALIYLHDRDCPIIHGDIKAVNVLISDAGEPLLADFGLSLIVEELSYLPMSSALLEAGNPRWMAPELLVGENTASKETDIWALGMTLLEIITMDVPFFDIKRDAEVILAIHHGRRPTKPQLHFIERGLSAHSDALWSLLQSCWRQTPKSRPSAISVRHTIEIITLPEERSPSPLPLASSLTLMNNPTEAQAVQYTRTVSFGTLQLADFPSYGTSGHINPQVLAESPRTQRPTSNQKGRTLVTKLRSRWFRQDST